MLKYFNSFLNDIRNTNIRYLYFTNMINNIQGDLGIKIRRSYYSKKFYKCGTGLIVNPNVRILNSQKIICGSNVGFGFGCYIQAGGTISFGDNVMLGPYTKIWSQNHKFSNYDIPIYEQGFDFLPVRIDNNVWIGANSFIMPGTVLGDHCVVSANSLVGAKTYPPGTILAGNPARKIGERKKE